MLFDVFVRRRRALMPAIHASSHEIKKTLHGIMFLCFCESGSVLIIMVLA